MSITQRVVRWLPQITAAITCALVVAISICFAILLPLSGKVADQAANGNKARDRSCALLPVARKIYGDQLNRHVITGRDYALVFGTAAQVCGTRHNPRP